MTASAPLRATAVVLAAGLSTRMGTLKQLLPLRGRPLVALVVDALLGRVDRIVVVLGHRAAEIEPALAGLPVQCVVNPDYATGMLGSVQCGLRAAGRPGPWLICLGDQPAIAAGVIAAVVGAGQAVPGSLVVPTWEGRGGHPLLIPEDRYTEALQLPAQQGLHALVRRPGAAVLRLPVADPAVLRDIDTPDDYRRELARQNCGET